MTTKRPKCGRCEHSWAMHTGQGECAKRVFDKNTQGMVPCGCGGYATLSELLAQSGGE